ncbi:hypothetical protein [uncultured Pseudokineococcus sp.]|uniref:hypothetical protein n=1 Tax=uncultured Pseudokineococcus sp. TaxID=1642928 RepID=UPI00262A4664|nr:hypothetical protein [uncultured Pseudokineococcus sp.]
MRVVVEVPARRSAPVVWRHLVDWPWQSGSIPLTRVFRTSAAEGEGGSFTGRTAVLGVGFDDPMDVVRWEPPTAGAPADGGRAGVAVLAKRGSVVLGSAALRVEPVTAGSCRVVWGEDVHVAPVRLTRPLEPLLRGPVWLGLRSVVVDMVRRVEAGTPEPLEP